MRIVFLTVIFIISGVNTAFTQKSEFPYKLNYTQDIIALSSGISLISYYVYLENNAKINYLTNEEVLNLNKNDINAFDRSATNHWSTEFADASDVVQTSLKYVPTLLLIPEIKNKNWNNILTLSIIGFEGYMITLGLTGCTKLTVKRKRPYLYNTTTITESEKLYLAQEMVSYKSFFSGHTSTSFFYATFLSKVYTDIYGKSKWSYIITGISLTSATTVGYLRYKAGKHYPTDIIVGAIVGSAVGYFIPRLHKRKNNNVTLYITHNNQLGFIYRF